MLHRALPAADRGSVTMTEVATRFGFYELGRFAVQYREAFGERPNPGRRGHAQALPPRDVDRRARSRLLALGFAGAFRRAELVALEVGDLIETPDGLRCTTSPSTICTPERSAGGGSSNRPAARSIGSPARSNSWRSASKTDKNDAAVLAKLHASGFLPEVWMPEVWDVWLVSVTATRGSGLRA